MSVHLSETHRGRAVNCPNQQPRKPTADNSYKHGIDSKLSLVALAPWQAKRARIGKVRAFFKASKSMLVELRCIWKNALLTFLKHFPSPSQAAKPLTSY